MPGILFLVFVALVIGVLLSARIIAAVHTAENSIHNRLRKLEETVKGKL